MKEHALKTLLKEYRDRLLYLSGHIAIPTRLRTLLSRATKTISAAIAELEQPLVDGRPKHEGRERIRTPLKAGECGE